jgi:hypothetical protein
MLMSTIAGPFWASRGAGENAAASFREHPSGGSVFAEAIRLDTILP